MKNISIHKNELLSHGIDWDKEIAQLEGTLNLCLAEVFVPVYFSNSLSQTGIDKYNQLLGGLPEKTAKLKAQGLNELINLARQKLSLKKYQLPNLHLLYKQILSKGDKPFIDAFKNDADMLAELDEFVEQQISCQTGAISKVKENITSLIESAHQSSDQIYIVKDKISVISQLLTGSWQSIHHWRSAVLNVKEQNKVEKKSVYSIAEIESWLAIELDGQKFLSNRISAD